MKVEGYNCQNALNIVGYQRSGQHAIAGWLMANLPSPSVFLNNLGPMGADRLWYIDGKRTDIPPKQNPIVVSLGLEGCYRRANDSPHLTVFVVRDIKNHMASIIKHPRFSPTWPEFFRIWEEYANVMSGDMAIDCEGSYISISFPDWFISRSYRENIFITVAGYLDLDFKYKDNGVNDMMASGGGSSFDKENYRGKASQMAVLSRYKSVELPFIPQRLLDINKDLFGDIYENH